MNEKLTDEGVENEIARLRESPYVKLAKKEERIRYRRKQYLYQLRNYEKKGIQLAMNGVTMATLDKMDNEEGEWEA